MLIIRKLGLFIDNPQKRIMNSVLGIRPVFKLCKSYAQRRIAVFIYKLFYVLRCDFQTNTPNYERLEIISVKSAS